MAKLKLTIKPVTQITFGLICLTVSILLVGDLLGLLPDPNQADRNARKKFAESIAVQFSSLANWKQSEHIEQTIQAIVERNDDVASAAVRSPLGHYLAGEHLEHWTRGEDFRSSSNQIVVPIYDGKYRWGTIELRFQPVDDSAAGFIRNNYLLVLVSFMVVSGAILYRFFIRRALRELDPSGAIPERVRTAFNALTEGVLILDEHGSVVLVNTSFEEHTGLSLDELLAQSTLAMSWAYDDESESGQQLPWLQVLANGRNCTNVRLIFNKDEENERVFLVNSVAITDDSGKSRGVLSTFDDVSELEAKNRSLQLALGKLKVSQKKIKAQNQELHLLATRDPMTNCLNRRSFYAAFEQLITHARENKAELSAIMVDIDHFKSINDNFGHAAGDEVIKILAQVLLANSRDIDLVGRYGGEEFAIVLKDMGRDGAESVANRILLALKESNAPQHTDGKLVTASLGVSTLANGAKDKEMLLDEADKALYVAKQSGRDQVVCWSPELASDVAVSKTPESVQETEQDTQLQTGSASTLAGDSALQSRLQELEQMAHEHKAELEALLNYDTLTGLKKRDPFHTSISQAIARGYRYEKLTAVISLTIQNFRVVNDSLGYSQADQLLAETALRLDATLRGSDVLVGADGNNAFSELSRVNTDEFGILISDLEDRSAIEAVIERLQHTIAAPVTIDGVDIVPEYSLGVAVFPDDGSYAELLTHRASLARQQAELTNSTFLFYTSELQRSAAEYLEQASA